MPRRFRRSLISDVGRAGRRLFEGALAIKQARLGEAASEREERRLRVAEAAGLAAQQEAERNRRDTLEFLTNPHVQEARALGFETPRERIGTMLDIRREERLSKGPPAGGTELRRALDEGMITPQQYIKRILEGTDETDEEKFRRRQRIIRTAGEEAATPFFSEAQSIADSLAERLGGAGPGAPAIDVTEEQIQRAIDEATRGVTAQAESARAAGEAEAKQFLGVGTQGERGFVAPPKIAARTELDATKSAQDIAAQIIARELPMPSRSDQKKWNKQVKARAEMWDAIQSSAAFEALTGLREEAFEAEAAKALRDGLPYFVTAQAEGKRTFRERIADVIGGR